MALETGTYISDLVSTNPVGTDTLDKADDHLRLIKSTVKATFPNITGAVTATHTELNYVDGVTSNIQAQLDAKSVFPAGTLMLFQQTAAPTGWTKQVTHDNKALRVVTGTAGSGGTTAFTSVFASRTPSGSISSTASTGTIGSTAVSGTVGSTTLSIAEMPSHTHDFNANGTGTVNPPKGYGSTGTVTTNATGGSGSHTHSFTGGSHSHTLTMDSHSHTFTGTAMDFAVQYVDLIIASKD